MNLYVLKKSSSLITYMYVHMHTLSDLPMFYRAFLFCMCKCHGFLILIQDICLLRIHS